MALLSSEEILKVALLARLNLDEDELVMFSRQLNDIIGHFEELRALDTEGVAPMSHIAPPQNVWRDDEVRPSWRREDFLSGAPRERDGQFLVPRIIGGEGEEGA